MYLTEAERPDSTFDDAYTSHPGCRVLPSPTYLVPDLTMRRMRKPLRSPYEWTTCHTDVGL